MNKENNKRLKSAIMELIDAGFMVRKDNGEIKCISPSYISKEKTRKIFEEICNKYEDVKVQFT